MSILAVLTAADGSTIGPAAYAANPDGSAPATLTIPGVASMFARGPATKRIQGTTADVYTLTGSGAPGGEQGSDPELAEPGRGSPGLLNPGDPGSPPVAVTYTYVYAYSAPVLTPVGER